MPLNVGFRRRAAKSEHVFFDELEVLALAFGRQKGSGAFAGTVLGDNVHRQSLPRPLDEESGTISEVNGKQAAFARLDVRYAFSGNQIRKLVDVQD